LRLVFRGYSPREFRCSQQTPDRGNEKIHVGYRLHVFIERAFRRQARAFYKTFILHVDCWPLPVNVELYLRDKVSY